MLDDTSTENMKNASEDKRSDRLRFLKYTAGAILAVAAAAAGYYALTPPPAPAPATTAATTTVLPPSPSSTTEVHVRLTVTSQAFKNGERIPSKHACDGEDVSPPLSWTGTPEETKSYALIMGDLDAPVGTFTHWVIFNIPAIQNSLRPLASCSRIGRTASRFSVLTVATSENSFFSAIC